MSHVVMQSEVLNELVVVLDSLMTHTVYFIILMSHNNWIVVNNYNFSSGCVLPHA